MIYLLDTDTIIYWLNGSQEIEQRASSVGLANIAYSIISHAELSFGAYNSMYVEHNLNNVRKVAQTLTQLAFDEPAAEKFGQIKTDLRREGHIILDADIMIASIALVQNLILVTNNTSHFERIPNLAIENWLR